MKTLVTGMNGFVGHHLRQRLDTIGLPEGVDLRSKTDLVKTVNDIAPDRIVHLAAQSFVPDSFKDPRSTFDTNFIGTLNLLEAAKEAGFTGTFLFVGTGDMYGKVDEMDLPIVEEHPLRPRNPYAVSKVAAEALCFQWSQTESFSVVMARPFNHIGPGQTERFAIADFAKQIIEIKNNRRPNVISVGDIDVTRDFTDVRDVVAAYEALLDHGKSGSIYNVCSGTERTIRSLLEQMIAIAGVEVTIEVSDQRLRRAEQRRVYGSNKKIAADTGWTPQIDINETLEKILLTWQEQLHD